MSNTLDTFKRFIIDEGEYQHINFQGSIQNIINMIKTLFVDSGIELKQNIDYSKALIVNIIPIDFAQAIMNILNNANDIMLERKIKNKQIKISVFKKNNNGIVTIEDNGDGIDKNKIEKIFNPYFTTKHQLKNTGLGLHTAKNHCRKL